MVSEYTVPWVAAESPHGQETQDDPLLSLRAVLQPSQVLQEQRVVGLEF
jgi:hypothetical protein